MKILITGANGQLGQCLQDVLRPTSHSIVALGSAELDITSEAAVQERLAAEQPDVVINAAAYSAVDRAEEEETLAFAVNADATDHLASAASNVDALFIHVSTDYVFDGTATEPYSEEATTHPLSVYGKSKLAGEQAASRADKHYIVRTAWVFSEYGNNFLKTMLYLGAERDRLSIVNDQIGTPTCAKELAAALVLLAEQRDAPSGIYHFSGGETCSWFDFADAIFAAAKEQGTLATVPALTPIPSSEYPTLAPRPAYSVLSSNKLAQYIGVHGRGDWRKALTPVVQTLTDSK